MNEVVTNEVNENGKVWAINLGKDQIAVKLSHYKGMKIVDYVMFQLDSEAYNFIKKNILADRNGLEVDDNAYGLIERIQMTAKNNVGIDDDMSGYWKILLDNVDVSLNSDEIVKMAINEILA